MKHLLVLLFLGLSLFSFPAIAQTTCEIEISVTNIETKKGSVRMGIYVDNTSFEDEKPLKKIVLSKKDISNSTIKTKISLPPGQYAIAMLDDVNDNKEMDYNFIGIPQEGFGFSNYYHTGITRPHFDDFKFSVTKEGANKVIVKVKYY